MLARGSDAFYILLDFLAANLTCRDYYVGQRKGRGRIKKSQNLNALYKVIHIGS